ncbi:hypothetical protein [Actinomadura sp. WMMB 499]|uniref:hypothetical protein n=1 Tax=Actinomadura sp. WMMB 499 TaxID=1219491 RepID=UPI00124448A6|nr:hypothetical protein [Actinomadura sp. WMMB 499]QFG22597.1 hypothetical protein F7P10_17200 [Actinomadura sp. WMMB 499]
MTGRNPLANVAVALLWILLGVAGVAGAVALTLSSLPDQLDEQRALDTATPCPAAPRASADCLWKQQFTISDIRLYAGRNSDITATLTDGEGTEWATAYPNNEPLLDDLDDGAPVVGTIWRGEIVRIAALGDVQRTTASPVGFAETYAGTALIAGSSGLLMLVAGGWRLRRRADPAMPSGLVGLLWYTGIMAGVTLAIGIVVASAEWPIWLIPVLWAAASVPVAGCTVLAVRKSGDISAALGGTAGGVGGTPAP